MNFKLFLSDSVGQSMVSHVHCFRSFLFDGFVQDTECSGVIGAERRRGLCVAQFRECNSEWGATLGVVKARSNFGFGCGGYHILDNGSDIEDGSVYRILFGGFVSQEKQTSEAASGVGNRKLRGMAVDVQYHVGGVISNCGIWVSG
jgi:hypothetical protein